LQADYQDFQQLNTEILAISVEELDKGRRVSDLLDLQYPVLSDPDHRVVEEYAVDNLLGDGLATPSIFLVDQEGILQWKYVGQDTTDRPGNEVILEQLRTLPRSN
jgi:peroxiredoxin